MDARHDTREIEGEEASHAVAVEGEFQEFGNSLVDGSLIVGDGPLFTGTIPEPSFQWVSDTVSGEGRRSIKLLRTYEQMEDLSSALALRDRMLRLGALSRIVGVLGIVSKWIYRHFGTIVGNASGYMQTAVTRSAVRAWIC